MREVGHYGRSTDVESHYPACNRPGLGPAVGISSQSRALTQDVGFPGGLSCKNPPAMRETRVQLLGREDPLEMG